MSIKMELECLHAYRETSIVPIRRKNYAWINAIAYALIDLIIPISPRKKRSNVYVDEITVRPLARTERLYLRIPSTRRERLTSVPFTSQTTVALFRKMQTSSLNRLRDVLQLLATCRLEIEHLASPQRSGAYPLPDIRWQERSIERRRLMYYQDTAEKASTYLIQNSVSHYLFHQSPTEGTRQDLPLERINTAFYHYGEQVIQLEVIREMQRQQLERVERLQSLPAPATDPSQLSEWKEEAEEFYTERLQAQENVLEKLTKDLSQQLERYTVRSA